MEIEAFFRNLSPCIQSSMWELSIIYIPGKKRILTCSILELQVKGRGSPLLFSICTIQRSPLIIFTTRGHRILGLSSFWLEYTNYVFNCWNYWKHYKQQLFVLISFKVSPDIVPFLWGAQDHMPHLKDLIWSLIMPCWASDPWAKLSRPADDLTRRKPTRAIGNSKKWKKCGNSKNSLWEEKLQGSKVSKCREGAY